MPVVHVQLDKMSIEAVKNFYDNNAGIIKNNYQPYNAVVLDQSISQHFIRLFSFADVKNNSKVLDIGSGAGKFCMIGSVCTNGHFTGVEQRDNLHLLAEQIFKKYQLKNINFINSNINQIEFNNYEAFYFFNPFYENIIQFEKIDDAIDVKNDLYDEYSNYVKNQLDLMPLGTRLVTFFSAYDEVPISYQLISKDDRQKISMWEKKE